MKLNVKSFALLLVIAIAFLAFAGQLALLYDNMTGEDYSESESFDSGGVVTILIYVIAIVLPLLSLERLKEANVFVPWSFVVLGLVVYLGRFTTLQIYERISYYFFYFVMLVFANLFASYEKKTKVFFTLCFSVLAIALFTYRISKGDFAAFKLCWQ